MFCALYLIQFPSVFLTCESFQLRQTGKGQFSCAIHFACYFLSNLESAEEFGFCESFILSCYSMCSLVNLRVIDMIYKHFNFLITGLFIFELFVEMRKLIYMNGFY